MLGIKTSIECKNTLVTPVEEWDESVMAVLSLKPFRRRSRECYCGELYNLSLKSCAKKSCSGSRLSRFRYNQNSQILITDPAIAVGRSWFHATIDPHWGSMLATHSRPTHVGFEETAHAVGREYHDATGGYWLYELRMKPSALIAEYFCPDLCMNWTTNMEAFSELVQSDFVGYVNQYETVGECESCRKRTGIECHSQAMGSVGKQAGIHQYGQKLDNGEGESSSTLFLATGRVSLTRVAGSRLEKACKSHPVACRADCGLPSQAASVTLRV